MTISNDTLSGNLGKDETIEIGSSCNATERAATGEFSKDVSQSRLNPNTTVDMYNVEKWQKGDAEPKGTAARSHVGLKSYRMDIENAPSTKDYAGNTIYVDTTRPIGPQLDKLNK